MTTTPPTLSPNYLQVPPTPLHGARYEHPREERFVPRRSARKHNATASPSASFSRDSCTTPPPTVARQPIRHSPRFSVKTETVTTTTTTTSTVTKAGRIGLGGLATPAKTPTGRKKQIAPSSSSSSTARVLFPTSSRSKTGGFSILGDDEEAISIFEDTKDRIPKEVQGEDNPFLTSASDRGQSRKRRRTKVNEEDQPTKDGMWYTFRGKKIYKKFAEEHSEPIKPRLLFPTEEDIPELEDELTDVPTSPILGPEDEEDNEIDIELTLDSSQKSEKDKVGKITKPSLKTSAQPAPKPKVRLQTPEPVEEPAAAAGSLFTPPPTNRRKRGRPTSFADDEAGPNTPQRPKAKMRKLQFDVDDEHHHGLQTPAKTPARNTRKAAMPQTPEGGETPRANRRAGLRA